MSEFSRVFFHVEPCIDILEPKQYGNDGEKLYDIQLYSIFAPLLTVPPCLSVSRAVQYLKDKSSYKLLTEYLSIIPYGSVTGDNICGRGDAGLHQVVMLTDEVWKAYIKNQKSPEPDDFEMV